MKTLLIDCDNLKLLKVVEGDNPLQDCARCEYWADILIPKGEFYICGEENRDLSGFTLLELTMLYNNTTGAKADIKDYPRALELFSYTRDTFAVANESLEELKKLLGKPKKAQSFKPDKEAPEKVAKPSSGIPTRPKDGSLTVRAWEAADWFYSEQDTKDINSKELRDNVVNTCVENGVNKATASTQFGKWKKHQIHT